MDPPSDGGGSEDPNSLEILTVEPDSPAASPGPPLTPI